MTKQEALSIIDSDLEHYSDRIVEMVFEHKQYLLKSVVTPPIFRKRAEKLMILAECQHALDESDFNNNTEPSKSIEIDYNDDDFDPVNYFINFYRTYEALISEYKLKFMNAPGAFVASEACFQIAEVEEQKLFLLQEITNHYEIGDFSEIKLTDFVDSGVIIRELNKFLELGNDAQQLMDNLVLVPEFKRDLKRSRKYVNFANKKK